MIANEPSFEADHPSSSTSCFPGFSARRENQIESDALGGPFFRPPLSEPSVRLAARPNCLKMPPEQPQDGSGIFPRL